MYIYIYIYAKFFRIYIYIHWCWNEDVFFDAGHVVFHTSKFAKIWKHAFKVNFLSIQSHEFPSNRI